MVDTEAGSSMWYTEKICLAVIGRYQERENLMDGTRYASVTGLVSCGHIDIACSSDRTLVKWDGHAQFILV